MNFFLYKCAKDDKVLEDTGDRTTPQPHFYKFTIINSKVGVATRRPQCGLSDVLSVLNEQCSCWRAIDNMTSRQ